MINYKKNARNMREFNLTEAGLLIDFDWDALDFDETMILENAGFTDNDPVDLPTLSRLDIQPEWTDSWISGFERDAALGSLIKHADHYLVFAHNCLWTGADGYTIANSLADTVYRSYDAAIYPVSASRGGKCLICKEFSHDVPTGAKTSIIALTDREYDRLSDASWEQIEAFAAKHEAVAEEKEVAA